MYCRCDWELNEGKQILLKNIHIGTIKLLIVFGILKPGFGYTVIFILYL